MARRSRGRVTLCAVCTVHEEKSASFLVEPQNKVDGFSRFGLKTDGLRFIGWAKKPSSTVCQWFDHKTTGTGFLVWPQNQGRRFVGLTLKSVASGFPIWTTKSAATVWWFGSQNNYNSFLVCGSKSSRLWVFGCATKVMGGWRRRAT
jgi:hypothetical protein